jgi:hypothetical protein
LMMGTVIIIVIVVVVIRRISWVAILVSIFLLRCTLRALALASNVANIVVV